MRPFSEQTSTTAETAIAALAEQLASVDAHAECHVLSQKLFSASRAAAEANVPDWPKVKALWLVAAACSMMLVPQSTNEPFKPMFVMADGSRSAVAEDFSPEDALLFSQVAEASTRCELRARLSDVAWICSQPKNVADARRAIDAYVSVQPTESDWTRLQDDWERAITLCMQLRQGAEDRQGKIEHALKRIVNRTGFRGGLLA